MPWDGVRIEGVKVPARREKLCPSAGGTSGGSRFHIPSLQGLHDAVDLPPHLQNGWVKGVADECNGFHDVAVVLRIEITDDTYATVSDKGCIIHHLDEMLRLRFDLLQDLPLQPPAHGIYVGGVVLKVVDRVSPGNRDGTAQ